jgi:hypothetical protein
VLGDANRSTGRRLFDAALAGGAQAAGATDDAVVTLDAAGHHGDASSTTGCSPPTTPPSSRSIAAACGWSTTDDTAIATASPRATARRSLAWWSKGSTQEGPLGTPLRVSERQAPDRAKRCLFSVVDQTYDRHLET